MARIGVFMNLKTSEGPGGDRESGRRRALLERELAGGGHAFKFVFGEGKYRDYPGIAQSLVSQSDYLVASCWPSMYALSQYAGTKPIVFAGLTDHPSDPGYPDYQSNIIGIKSFSPSDLCANWPVLLKQIADVTRWAVIYDQDTAHPCMGEQNRQIGLETARPINAVSTVASDISDFAGPDGKAGLIVTAGTRTALLRNTIIQAVSDANSSTAKLFAIYPNSMYVDAGGLMSYGPNLLNLYWQAAALLATIIGPPPVDPNDIGSIVNSTFELFINQKAASALGITNIRRRFNLVGGGTVKPTIVSVSPPPPS